MLKREGFKKMINNFNKQTAVVLSTFLFVFVGCTFQRTFTNVALKEGDFTFDEPHKLVMTIPYTENGEPKFSKEGEMLGYMEDAFSDVGFAKQTSEASSSGTMHITINHITNLAEQITKEYITYYTWGLIGYHIKDKFIMDVELNLNGETIKKSGYKHEISYIAGLFQEKKVSGKREMDSSKALEKAAQQLALKFLNDNKNS